MKDLSRYLKFRNNIKSGDLLEWRPRSALGWLIRLFTRAKVSHTSMCLALDKYMSFDQPRKFQVEALPHGVALTLISRSLEEFDGEVYWVPLFPGFDALRDEIAKWIVCEVGKKYDYASLFKNIKGPVIANGNKLFCSELAFLALKHVGLVDGMTAPRPGEFSQYAIYEQPIRIL